MFLLYFILTSIVNPQVDIVLDPGHGGTNLGAAVFQRSDIFEKDLTLKFGKFLHKRFGKAGVKTVLTRTKDRYLTLLQRTEIVKKHQPKCFISLHFNASPLHNKKGIEIYFPPPHLVQKVSQDYNFSRKTLKLSRGNTTGKLLAQTYLHQLQRRGKANQSRNFARKLSWRMLAKGYKINNIERGNYDVLIHNGVKSILFEGGFVDHGAGAAKILKDQYLKKLAGDMVKSMKGICY